MSILSADSSASIIETTSSSTSTDLPIFKEYAWDFVNDTFKKQDGNLIVVEKEEALKVWAYKAIKTTKYKFMAYSSNYGNQYKNLIGRDSDIGSIQSDLTSCLEECLLSNSYFTSVNMSSVTLSEGIATGTVSISTIYNTTLEVSV